MSAIAFVIRYSLPHLRRYWFRFALGLFLGILYGLFQGVPILVCKVTFERLEQPTSQITLPAPSFISAEEPATWEGKVKATLHQAQEYLGETLDDVLPRRGRAIDCRRWSGWLQILGCITLFPLIFTIRGALSYFSSYFMKWVNERIARDLRCDVLRKLNTFSIDYFNQSTIADMSQRVYGDTQLLLTAMYLGLSDLIKEPITILTITGTLAWIDWRLAIMALLFIPLCIYPITVLGKKVRAASKRSVEIGVDASGVLIDAIRNIRVVKAFGLEEKQNEEFQALCNRIVLVAMKSTRATEMLNPTVEILASLTLGIIILYILMADVKISSMIALGAGLVLLPNSVKKLAGIHNSFQKAVPGVERLQELSACQPTVVDPPNGLTLTCFEREITLKNVSFAYGEKRVLKNVDLVIPAGKKLGIAGPTGSGKSTLVNLLLRFYDVSSGEILIDGQNIRDYTLASLRSQMAIVSQEVLLFNRSVAENISLGALHSSREEIETAAKKASAHEFILSLPKGYETVIGEAGVRISGGQRQRLAIARAFIRNAPILLMDEATAALDAQTEAEIQGTLEKLAAERTVVCVAHRLSTLTWCDKILFIQDGEIVESGSFPELIALKGRFHQMAATQGLTNT